MKTRIPTRPQPSIQISGRPRPVLQSGLYFAECYQATYGWSRRYHKWQAHLKFNLLNYTGPAFMGEPTRFLNLGNNQAGPIAGAASDFYRLFVDINGDQPNRPDISDESLRQLFCGRMFEVEVVPVKVDQWNKPLPVPYSKIGRHIHLVHQESTNLPTHQPANPANPHNPLTLKQTQQPTNPHNPPLQHSGKTNSRGLGRTKQQIPHYPQGGIGVSASVPPSTLPAGVRLLKYEPKAAPIRIPGEGEITDVETFIAITLQELDARLRGDDWGAHNWSLETVVKRLAAVGVEVATEGTQTSSHL